ncbi:hypothetical protein PHIN10_17660 [Polynucleobacter sp. HIN10]|nr:hypothetical protein PHIN9_17710 [Polynucleobacter sp. HIN9]BEI43617.1 hypothetical protein PHIN10_17660 [Polynucleobacter sp. HIN10]BEI45391.1 hypothetical protein PHIN11_17630 [Polynucleobacter sp. HIN11]
MLDEMVPLIFRDVVELLVEFKIAWLPETVAPELIVTTPAESKTNCSQSTLIVAFSPPVTEVHGAECAAFEKRQKNEIPI